MREALKTTAPRGAWTLALLLVLLSGGAGVGQSPPSFQELEESLTCQCGCGLTVHSCNHLQCPSALPLRDELRAQMKEGKDKEAILAHFSNKYGEKILSSPTTTGFNLVAWIAPFVVVGLGGVFLVMTLKRWSTRSRPVPVEPATVPPVSSHSKTFEKELKDFDA